MNTGERLPVLPPRNSPAGSIIAIPLSLSLFMAGVSANYIDDAVAAHDLAVLANSFYAGTDFHDSPTYA